MGEIKSGTAAANRQILRAKLGLNQSPSKSNHGSGGVAFNVKSSERPKAPKEGQDSENIDPHAGLAPEVGRSEDAPTIRQSEEPSATDSSQGVIITESSSSDASNMEVAISNDPKESTDENAEKFLGEDTRGEF